MYGCPVEGGLRLTEDAGSASSGRGGALLERDRELGELDDLARGALDGRAAVAFVEGPAGIGKSRLLAAVRERADAEGFRVLAARGSDFERDFPFGVVRQLFEPALTDAERRARWLSGPAQQAARVFEPPEDADATSGASFGLLYGLFWLTANIAADGPLLLVIDDLHWCDRSSLRFITFLQRRLEGLRVLVATASRAGEAGEDARLLDEIAHDPTAVSIQPALLGEAAVGELVRERLGPLAALEFCAACHRATGGNPLLLTELLRTLQAEAVPPDREHLDAIGTVGPRAVSRAVLLRLARLDASSVAVARAVAVLGDGANLASVAGLAGFDESDVADRISALAAVEILRPEAPVGFVHPLVRDAVYQEMAASARELQHARAAATLSRLGAAPEAVAVQLLHTPARADAGVAALLRDAGRAAGRRGDADSAVAYLRRALAEPPAPADRPRLLFELGTAEALLNVPGAVEHLREAEEQLDDPLERARAAELAVRTLIFTRPPQEAVAAARRAIALLPPELADARQALEAIELKAPTFGAPVGADSAQRLARARAGVDGDGPGARMLAAVAAYDWALTGGGVDECTGLALAALADGSLAEADPVLLAGVATSVLSIADHERTLDELERLADAAQRIGSPFALSGVHYMQAWTWLARGELEEAEQALQRSAVEAVPWSSTVSGYWVCGKAQVAIERGDLSSAEDLLMQLGPQMPGSDGERIGHEARAQLALARGAWREALAAAEACGASMDPRIVNPAWIPWRSLKALALQGLGDDDGARSLLEQELAAARTWGAPRTLSRALRLLGAARGGSERLALLEEAVAVAEGTPARLEHAKALSALGAALRRERQPAAARDPLSRGFALASRLGAVPVAEDTRAELLAAGARPRREALSGPGSLTPSELRVAGLAADGLSNRDIAQRLFVTPKTVEVHLTSVYRKLGIPGRAGLADALSDPA
jgi:DNA-binding CsgD family transcriptional regulator